jgi:predicted alpha/beta-fold hydrolase
MHFAPPPWLRNAHAQTLWAYLGQGAPSVRYERQTIATDDGDEVDLDWVYGGAGAPVLLACHGLEGSSDSPYMRRLMGRVAQKGWTGAVLHSRSCSGRMNQAVISYHSGFIDDLVQIVPLVAARVAPRPVFLVGYSLGGSLVVNYLGRRADALPENVRAAFVCSAPLNLAPGADALDRGLSRLYQFRFLRTLRRKVRTKARDHGAWAHAATAAGASRTLRDFDDRWTAPVHGFHDAGDYYERASSAPYLAKIRVPTRVLHADDDPFVTEDCVPRQALEDAPAVTYTSTRGGGHVGFVSGDSPHWLEDEILGWLWRQVEPLV